MTTMKRIMKQYSYDIYKQCIDMSIEHPTHHHHVHTISMTRFSLYIISSTIQRVVLFTAIFFAIETIILSNYLLRV
ncbi:hypothetical protein ASPFODRAFT_405379 [Aspergillus luchuensis CBS 106.47]|uniref:Uncharacterized protein n=1 Tax=Aspergillus luchuensis (strain CBS 106.47) TaxID=1137211 RepID=A0A1M3T1U4_ASPLC|nr:hypothetical protein ASPFODRAFT_405379 [Aspergillus luchuensis CBS 106.47]